MNHPFNNTEILENLVKFSTANEWNKLRQLSQLHTRCLTTKFLNTIHTMILDVKLDESETQFPIVYLNNFCPSIPYLYKKLCIPQLRFFDLQNKNMDRIMGIISLVAPYIENLEIGYQKRQLTYCLPKICYFLDFLKQFTNLKTFSLKIYTGLDLATIHKEKLKEILPPNCEIYLETRPAMQMFEWLFIAGAGNFPNFMYA